MYIFSVSTYTIVSFVDVELVFFAILELVIAMVLITLFCFEVKKKILNMRNDKKLKNNKIGKSYRPLPNTGE